MLDINMFSPIVIFAIDTIGDRIIIICLNFYEYFNR